MPSLAKDGPSGDIRLKAGETLRSFARQLDLAAEDYIADPGKERLLKLQSVLASIQLTAMAVSSPGISYNEQHTLLTTGSAERRRIALDQILAAG